MPAGDQAGVDAVEHPDPVPDVQFWIPAAGQLGVSACDFNLTVCATTRTDGGQLYFDRCHRKAPQARRAPKAAPVAARARNSITLCCMVNLRNRPRRGVNTVLSTGNRIARADKEKIVTALCFLS